MSRTLELAVPALLLVIDAASALRLNPTRVTMMCAAAASPLPPPLKDADNFQRGSLAAEKGWWRQDAQLVQLVVPLAEDASFKRDVSIDVSRTSIELVCSGESVLQGELAFEIKAGDADWYVEEAEDLQGFGDGAAEKYLVVELPKRESFVDWAAPLGGSGGGTEEGEQSGQGGQERRRLIIGGKGEQQKQACGQQLASYQILQKLPSAVRGDVYARAPPSAAGDDGPSERLYFIGKVIAEACEARFALAAQEVLVKEHARLYLPDVFGIVEDDADMELWLAPGNTEVRVAQNEITLKRWTPLVTEEADDVRQSLPSAGACGFEPETEPPPHIGTEPFSVKRDQEGRPLGEAFQANIVSPDEVPGGFEAWLKDQ